jgi:hypothetical protein
VAITLGVQLFSRRAKAWELTGLSEQHAAALARVCCMQWMPATHGQPSSSSDGGATCSAR